LLKMRRQFITLLSLLLFQLSFCIFPGLPAVANGQFTINDLSDLSEPLITTQPENIPIGFAGQAYNLAFSADGGTSPYTWSITDDGVHSLPDAISINPSSGELIWVPSQSGLYSIKVTVTDSSNPALSDEKVFLIPIITPGESILNNSPNSFYPDVLPAGSLLSFNISLEEGPDTIWAQISEPSIYPEIFLTEKTSMEFFTGSNGNYHVQWNGSTLTNPGIYALHVYEYVYGEEPPVETNPIAVGLLRIEPNNASINPTTGNFDKKTELQEDITITMTLNGNTLTEISNGEDLLIQETDYTVSGDTVTIKKEYLAEQATGTTFLTFRFSNGATQGLEIIISDSSATATATLEVLPAAEGYEFHLRNVGETTPSQYYGVVYESASSSPYSGSTIVLEKNTWESTYEYVSVPIVSILSESYPVGYYEMKVYSDSTVSTQVYSADFTIYPMVHITEPGLHDSTYTQDITISGYISNYTALTSVDSLKLNFNGTELDISTYLDTGTGLFSMPVTLREGDNNFVVTVQYSPSQLGYSEHQIWGEINYTVDECFIATAAYGSKFQPSVALLRHFRDDYLMTNPFGQLFVSLYYQNSPPLAAFIADSAILKVLARIMLSPVIAMVYLLYNPWMAISIFLGAAFAWACYKHRKLQSMYKNIFLPRG